MASFDIYTMNADGSGVTRVTNNAVGDAEPAWSPDGTKIAFESCGRHHEEIYTMNADGSAVTRLTNNGTRRSMACPTGSQSRTARPTAPASPHPARCSRP